MDTEDTFNFKEAFNYLTQDSQSDNAVSKSLLLQLNNYLKRESKLKQGWFCVSEEGSINLMIDDEMIELCNVLLLPVCDKTIHYPDYSERFLEVACKMNGIWQPTTSLSPVQLRKNQDWLRSSYGFKAKISCKYEMIVLFIETLLPIIPSTHQYTYIGWSKKHPGIYITGSEVIGDCGEVNVMPHPCLSKFQLRKPLVSKLEAVIAIFNLFMEVGTHDVTYTAISFNFLSCYTSLLEELPQKPESVYYLYGQTGSRKTAVSKLLLNPFENWESVPINFTATTPAMELTMMERRDTVTLIDDIPPSTSILEKRNLEVKVERIFRSTGDSVGRQKMHSKTKKVEMKPMGLIAITAEDNVLKSSSSYARGFFVTINRETVDLNKLTEAQSSHHLYSAAIYYFIEYIANNTHRFTQRIEMQFRKYEHHFAHNHPDAHGRQIASAAWLQTSFHFFLKFSKRIGAINQNQVDAFLQEMGEILHKKLKEMIKETDSKNEIELFVRALKELIATKTIALADIQLVGKKQVVNLPANGPKLTGYRDDRYMYLLPDSTFSYVNSYYAKHQMLFPVTTKTLWSRLSENKLLVPDRNQDGTKTTRITVNGDRISVIRIDREVFETWGEDPYYVDLKSLPGSLAGSLQYK